VKVPGSPTTTGRHITSKKGGLQVAAERKAHVEANRKASAALFNSDKLTMCPEQKKNGNNQPGRHRETGGGLFLWSKNSTGFSTGFQLKSRFSRFYRF
jgi:hypothetical protein